MAQYFHAYKEVFRGKMLERAAREGWEAAHAKGVPICYIYGEEKNTQVRRPFLTPRHLPTSRHLAHGNAVPHKGRAEEAAGDQGL